VAQPDPQLAESEFAVARSTLHRVAAHILGRRRYEVSSRFGLRASPGGIATPAFGDGTEVLRVTGGVLMREKGGQVGCQAIAGTTLRALAAFAGADIEAEFSCGPDTPPTGDLDEPLALDPEAFGVLATWYQYGWGVLDNVLSARPAASADPDVIQLWPEHFDAGTNFALAGGSRVGLGASPGDAYVHEPYLYVGPWGPERPGDPSYWNAPFGAVLTRGQLIDRSDRLDAGVAFVTRGLRLLEG
jgi:hypothetical protein